MTFDQLDYFIAAAKCATFLEAAESLHISQSTLSKQIQNLERELNLQLFDRSKRSASLTEAGKMFYTEALQLSGLYHQTLLHVSNFRESANPELHISTLPILSQYNILSLLKGFARQYPEISLCMEEGNEAELLDNMTQCKSDFIIVRNHMLDMTKYNFHPLAEDRLVVLLPSDHPLAGHPSVNIREIARENFILMRPGTSLYQLCIRLFHEADIRPNILRTAHLQTIIGEIEINRVVSLSAEENIKIYQNSNFAAVPLAPSPRLLVGVAYPKGRRLSGAALTFLQYLRSLPTAPAQASPPQSVPRRSQT